MATFRSSLLRLATVSVMLTGACAHDWRRSQPPEPTGPILPPSAAFAIDSAGNHVLGGSTAAGPVASGLSRPGSERLTAYVAKRSSSGQTLWTAQFAGSGSSQVTGLMLDAQGHVTVTGTFRDGTVDLDGERLQIGTDDKRLMTGVFAAKLDGSSGRRQWLKLAARAAMADGVSVTTQVGRLRVSFRWGGFLQVGDRPPVRHEGKNMGYSMSVIGFDERTPMGANPARDGSYRLAAFQPPGSNAPGAANVVSTYVINDSLQCAGLICWFRPTCQWYWDDTCKQLANAWCGWPL